MQVSQRNSVAYRAGNFGGNARPVRFGKGHLLTASFTVSDKKNINDDFSPEFPFGYPNDPSKHRRAEWGQF